MGKKIKKCFGITQVAPLEPVNKYGMDSDHGLDKDNKRSECMSIKILILKYNERK